MLGAHSPCKRDAIHGAGHPNIADHELDARDVTQHVNGFVRMSCFELRKARVPQLFGDHHPHEHLVFHDKESRGRTTLRQRPGLELLIGMSAHLVTHDWPAPEVGKTRERAALFRPDYAEQEPVSPDEVRIANFPV